MRIEDMDVFRLAHEMVLKIYKITADYPDGEKYGLTPQMRRATSSVCMNLMEGGYRAGRNEYKHFVSISRGSCGEVKYQLLLSKDLGYITADIFNEYSGAYDRLLMMLTKLHNSL
ncbi:MAG: four helix bundle protein [Nitrospirae bacterium]|nr:four helix bundle protein [Nitrospirota bacterium]